MLKMLESVDTATLITWTLVVLFGAILIGILVEDYFLRRKRTKHAH